MKQTAFSAGNQEEVKTLQRTVKEQIDQAKDNYKKKCKSWESQAALAGSGNPHRASQKTQGKT